jgi:hypothetical protein
MVQHASNIYVTDDLLTEALILIALAASADTDEDAIGLGQDRRKIAEKRMHALL